MNPVVQVSLAQVTMSLSVPPPLTKPPKMETTMQISEELERQERDIAKEMEEEPDDYHEHPKHQELVIDEVVHEGEEIQSSK